MPWEILLAQAGGAVVAGGAILLLYRLLANGRLYTKSQVDEILRSRDQVITGMEKVIDRQDETVRLQGAALVELQEQGRTTLAILQALRPDRESQ